MVSFCDLSLSELRNHMDKYGDYGIGLSNTWATKMGLNPVFYVNKDSNFANDLISGINRVTQFLMASASDPDLKFAYIDAINAYRFIKNYEGELARENEVSRKHYRFADEREWRYVPSLSENIPPFVQLNQIDSNEKKKQLNTSLRDLRLSFQPSDIQYLIVSTDEEKIALMDHLESDNSKYSEPIRRHLSSRILSADQLNVTLPETKTMFSMG